MRSYPSTPARRLLAIGLLCVGLGASVACSEAGLRSDAIGDDAVSDAVADAVDAPPSTAVCADFVGSAWRFTSIYATEPDDPTSTADAAVRDILNELFARYIEHGVLNVMYEIVGFEPATGRLQVRAGPAMAYPDGKLHMLCGYDAVIPMRFEGAHFQTTRPEHLNIHCGTTDAPATCAPEISAANAVPIAGLDTAGELRSDCAAGTGSIEGAALSGYITTADAEGLCICTSVDPATGADTCDHEPVGGEPLYCKAHCGARGYAHFGTVLRVVAKIASVDYQGVPAYRFAGTYSAVRVAADRYDAACCTSLESCP